MFKFGRIWSTEIWHTQKVKEWSLNKLIFILNTTISGFDNNCDVIALLSGSPLYVTYLHDVLYVCTTSICFLFSQRDHYENKVYF